MATQHPVDEEQIPPPTGTTFILTLYMLLLATMWGLMFLGLIGGR